MTCFIFGAHPGKRSLQMLHRAVEGRSIMAVKPIFKACTCGKSWSTRDDFLSDTDNRLIGYQANFQELELGLFYFNHESEGCHTTISFYAKTFSDLHDGPVFKENLKGVDSCPDYCVKKEEMRSCPLRCECAWVRDVIGIIQKWPKSN